MRNIALFLTYVGTAYHGWQVQKNEVTVAETLEQAAAAVVGHPVKFTGCGRTDGRRPCQAVCGKLFHLLQHPRGSAALCPQYAFARGYRGHRRPRGARELQRHRLVRAQGVYVSHL